MIAYPYNTTAVEKETYSASDLGLTPVSAEEAGFLNNGVINTFETDVEYLYIGNDVDLSNTTFVGWAGSSDGASYAHTLKEVVFEDGRATIENVKFLRNLNNETSTLTKVVLPKDLTGTLASFQDNRGLTSIDIPDGVTDIPDYCFWRCYALKEVKLPHNLTYMGELAFYGCALESITIPAGVEEIGPSALQCQSLTTINFEGTQDQWNSIVKDDNWLGEGNKKAPVTVIHCVDGDINL